MATIEEKARVYSGLDQTLASNNLLDNSTRYMANCGFRDGAKWMLEKAVKWLKENAQNYYEDAAMHDNCWYDDEQMIEDFQKTMKE